MPVFAERFAFDFDGRSFVHGAATQTHIEAKCLKGRCSFGLHHFGRRFFRAICNEDVNGFDEVEPLEHPRSNNPASFQFREVGLCGYAA